MNNITIGIIARDSVTDNIDTQIITKNNLKYLHNKCNYIGILNYDNTLIDTKILDLCDAIIFQGGSDIYPYHFQILKYCLNNNKPVLGICMGHQIIGLYSIGSTNDKNLIKVEKHNDKEKKHIIKTSPNSFINKALGNTPEVNTRHDFALEKVNMPFKETSRSKDKVIESIEYIDDNHFVIGVQFHPEDLDNTENLYNLFIKEVFKRKKK